MLWNFPANHLLLLQEGRCVKVRVPEHSVVTKLMETDCNNALRLYGESNFSSRNTFNQPLRGNCFQ